MALHSVSNLSKEMSLHQARKHLEFYRCLFAKNFVCGQQFLAFLPSSLAFLLRVSARARMIAAFIPAGC